MLCFVGFEELGEGADEYGQNNFNIATQRLTTADEEISSLRDTNNALKTENESLRDHNSRLHTDLETAIPTIFRLKAHLDVLSQQVYSSATHTADTHADTTSRDDESALENSIEQLHHEWTDIDRDFQDIYRRYRKNGGGSGNGSGRTDSVMGSGKGRTPPLGEGGKGSAETSEDEERMHRSRIIIKRGGIVRRIDAEPASSSGSDRDGEGEEGDESGMGETLVGGLEGAGEMKDKEVSEVGGEDVKVEENASQQDRETTAPTPETPSSAEQEKPMKKQTAKKGTKDLTPWQELCASIADFAGWHDAYED